MNGAGICSLPRLECVEIVGGKQYSSWSGSALKSKVLEKRDEDNLERLGCWKRAHC